MRDTIVDLLTGSVMGVIIWFGVPVLLRTFGREPDRRRRAWLIAAIACILVSYFLPNPWLQEYTLSFSQHFVGGGVASGLVGYYLIGHFAFESRFHRFLVVAALVSTMGVANELVELALDLAFGVGVVIDASWDLLANTVGAMVVVVTVEAVRANARLTNKPGR